MKKNRIILAAIVVLALIVTVVAVIPAKSPDPANTPDSTDIAGTQTNNTPSAGANPDAKIITFTVPDFGRIDDENLRKFNEALINDGYNYALKIKYLDYDAYAELLGDELRNGETDVAFLGLGNADGSNNIISLINDGLVLELDGILSQESGAELYNAFPKNLWESVRSSGRIYSIPSALADDHGVFVAFNRDYIADDVIAEWDGSIEGIYEIIDNVEWDDSIAPRFVYNINDYAFDDMIDCEIRNGLLFDYESLSIENPLESEKFTGSLSVLDRMKKDGYMSDSTAYLNNPGLNSAEVLVNVEAGNYLVALSHGSVDEVFLKDNIAVRTITPYLSSRINGSIGISKNADDIDDVVEFLGLFYGDGKYGNILLYGQEGSDYQVVDGVACNMDGIDLSDNYLTKLFFDLFVNIHPVNGEKYMNDRKNEFFAFYDSVELSPFISFEPDTTGMNNIASDLNGFMSGLRNKTVDESIGKARDKLESDGIDEYLSGVKSQWEEYRQ